MASTLRPVICEIASQSYIVEVFHGSLSDTAPNFVGVEAAKTTRADEIVADVVRKLDMGNPQEFELVEVFTSGGQICKERKLFGNDNPVKIQLLWPRLSAAGISDTHQPGYNFMLRHKEVQQKPGVWVDSVEMNPVEGFLARFLQQPRNREYQDLCNLPDLNETTLLENLRKRFNSGMIYTYVGSILISINPFRFYPIYNPKYVRMYQNRQLSDLPPHIFAIADSAYYAMMKTRANQCIVISGESGSGKTESNNLLLYHLSALSQRGFYSDGIEQSILGVGPVLEAFGNAKTVHNNNSSRFGKFVQVNYRVNGSVHGASVEKYLLEKSRIVSQASNERNYHVFYYLLAGASAAEIESFCLGSPREYFYLNQNDCYRLEGLESDYESMEFARLRHAMDVVGFSHDNQQRIFTILSAVLHIGNIEFKKKSEQGFHDEAVNVKNMKEISIVSKLLRVRESTLIEALTKRKTMAGGEIVVMSHKMADAISTRDAMSKCLYSALFDWIVFQINTALVSKHDRKEHKGNSIGVLDIFGFEDFQSNSFEQFCINYANESLHYYFNQHIFKFEQEEYMREGIQWKNIEFIDNTECLDLFCKKPTGLLYLLDEECSFPGATNETLLNKFSAQHQNNPHFRVPQTRQSAFSIIHYAGKVKYSILDFREKNNDLMRHDILVLLKNSNLAFLRELVGQDPLAVLRWALVRVFFQACFAFIDSGRRHRKAGSNVARFGGILRTEPLLKRIPLLSDSKISLFPGKTKSRPERRLAHSPSLDLSPFSSPLSARIFQRKSNRRLSCPDDNEAIAEASEIFEKQKLGSNPVLEETPQKEPICLSKNKVYRPRFRALLHLRELETNKTLSSTKVPIGIRTSKTKTKPRSISAQFHNSLQRLMDTLNQANPFFIRCIKSNADKAPCVFDEELVQRQLRYTGMLATVKIRQSGYNYRLSFEDFIYQYHLLLPNGRRSSRNNIVDFLNLLDLNQENYQIGINKVFLREAEKLLLEDALHQALLVKIKRIQHWIKGRVQRMRYLQIRSSTVMLQSLIRGVLARRRTVQLQRLRCACVLIQSAIRGLQIRILFRRMVAAVINIQRIVRGFLTRRRLLKEKEKRTKSEIINIIQPYAVDLGTEQVTININSKTGDICEEKSASDEENQPNANSVNFINGRNISTSTFRAEFVILGNSSQRQSNRITILKKADFSVNGQHVSDSKSAQSEGDISVFSEEEPSFSEAKITCRLSLSDSVDGACVSVAKFDSPSVDLSPPFSPAPSESAEAEVLAQESASESKIGGEDASNRTVDADKARENLDPVGPSTYRPRFLVDRSGSKDDLYLIATAADRSLFSLENSSPEEKDASAKADWTKPNIRGQDLTLPHVSIVRELSRSAPHSPSGLMGESKDGHFDFACSEGRNLIPFKNILRDNSPSLKRIEKCLSEIIPNVRTQEGPHDVVIEVKPAIVKASSAEILSGNSQTISVGEMGEKRLQAPLARMESDEPSEKECGVETICLVIEDVKKPVPPEKVALEEISSSPLRSRFLSRKNPKKHQNAGKDGSTVEGYDNSSKKVRHHTPLRQRLRQPSPAPVLPSLPPAATPGTTSHSSTAANAGSWSVFGTAQWKYPLDLVVRSINELKQLEHFFATKVASVGKNADPKKSSVYDVVFNGALNEFHSNLITQISTLMQVNNVTHKYKDLMCIFEEILSAKVRQLYKEDTPFPDTIFINAFRGFVDEFIKKRDNKELPDVKVKKNSIKGKKKKENVVLEYLLHRFLQIQFTIPTFCEMCSSVIWVLEKGYVCKTCKFTVHKKCYEKSHIPCAGCDSQVAIAAQVGSTVIGAPLSVLVKNGHQIPPVIDRLLAAIEMNGLYTVGVYRKSGNAAHIKQLIKDINTDSSNIEFSNYHIHVLTAVFKAFFREMPEPLMTFDFYDDFIRLAEINDDKERIKLLYGVIGKLPQANHTLLERLIFHLARVSNQEELNLMSPNALAIVFAPSILRTQNKLSTQESLSHVSKQTLCVQSFIEWQLKKIKSTLADIRTLDTATINANEKLATLRATRKSKLTVPETEDPLEQEETPEFDREELLLSAKIQSLQDERDTLTSLLPALECRMSNSEEDLLSTDDIESTGDELDDCDIESQISTSDTEGMQRAVRNLTRRRSSQLQPPENRMENCHFVDASETLESPFELKPTTSDPELRKSLVDDPFQ